MKPLYKNTLRDAEAWAEINAICGKKKFGLVMVGGTPLKHTSHRFMADWFLYSVLFALGSESPKQKIVRYEIMASTVDVILPLAHEFRLRPDHCYLKHQ
jgi:hypothetical protein